MAECLVSKLVEVPIFGLQPIPKSGLPPFLFMFSSQRWLSAKDKMSKWKRYVIAVLLRESRRGVRFRSESWSRPESMRQRSRNSRTRDITQSNRYV